MKKNELLKHLFLVAVSFFTSLMAYSQEYFSRISTEGVDLIGSITFGMLDKYTQMTPGFYLFDYDRKFQPDKGNPLFSIRATGGSTYHNGKIYCNEYDGSSQVQFVKPKWKIYDATTFQLLFERELNDNFENTTISLAYDLTTDKIYGFIKNIYGDYCNLAEIDPETGTMVKIGDALDSKYSYFCLACSKKGQLYGICAYRNNVGDEFLYLVKFRKSDGKMAIVGEIKVENLLSSEDLMIIMSADHALFFNNSNDKLYWMLPSSSMALASEYTPIVEVNVVNASATLISYLPDSFRMSGAFFKEPSLSAPSIVSDFQFIPKAEGVLNGVLKFKIPETAYGGEELQGEVSVIVKEKDKELINKKLKPGVVFMSEELSFSNDKHTVSIMVKNESGEGPTIQRSFYVGYDIPRAPQNIVLTSDNLKTTLTWDPPVEGINGAVINPNDYTYTVIRYPYEITVAEGLKERRFVEEHPGDMTRYVYEVLAVDGTRAGERGFSNNLIIGNPLNPPYGGIFKGPADMYNYYTILDENADGHSWLYDVNTASAFYTFNVAKEADDWLISPPINYQKGKEYVLKFKAYSSMVGYLESMEVRVGNGKTPEAQDRLLLDLPEIPTASEESPVTEYETEFTVEEDGIYYYSFHANSPRYHEFLYLFDIRLTEKNQSSVFDTEINSINIQARKGVIQIDNQFEIPVIIYNSNGEIIKKAKDSLIVTLLPPGVYMIQVLDRVYKTVVF